MKLTIPQQNLLARLYRASTSIYIIPSNPPAKALVKLGLAHWVEDARLEITITAILKAAEKEEM